MEEDDDLQTGEPAGSRSWSSAVFCEEAISAQLGSIFDLLKQTVKGCAETTGCSSSVKAELSTLTSLLEHQETHLSKMVDLSFKHFHGTMLRYSSMMAKSRQCQKQISNELARLSKAKAESERATQKTAVRMEEQSTNANAGTWKNAVRLNPSQSKPVDLEQIRVQNPVKQVDKENYSRARDNFSLRDNSSLKVDSRPPSAKGQSLRSSNTFGLRDLQHAPSLTAVTDSIAGSQIYGTSGSEIHGSGSAIHGSGSEIHGSVSWSKTSGVSRISEASRRGNSAEVTRSLKSLAASVRSSSGAKSNASIRSMASNDSSSGSKTSLESLARLVKLNRTLSGSIRSLEKIASSVEPRAADERPKLVKANPKGLLSESVELPAYESRD